MDFDLEGDSPAVADVDNACVFAGTLQHAWALGGELAQEGLRVLVAAVLAPHRARHAKFDHCGRAAKHSAELTKFVACEAYFGE